MDDCEDEDEYEQEYDEEDSLTQIRDLSENNKPSIIQYTRAFLSLSFTLKLKFLLKLLLGIPSRVISTVKYILRFLFIRSRLSPIPPSSPPPVSSSRNEPDNLLGEESLSEVKELKRLLLQKEQSLRLLHNEADSICEDFEDVYDQKELFRDSSWRDFFYRMKSFSDLSKRFVDDDSENGIYLIQQHKERATNEAADDHQRLDGDIESASQVITSVADPHSSKSELSSEIDPLSSMLDISLEKLYQSRQMSNKVNGCINEKGSESRQGGEERKEVYQWRSVQLPPDWLKQEEERRSKPGDAVYDGPTARIQTSIHRE